MFIIKRLIQEMQILQTNYFVFIGNCIVGGQFPCNRDKTRRIALILTKSVVQIIIETCEKFVDIIYI